MEKQEWLAEAFEESRPHLQAVAYRLLGSLSEADDAVASIAPISIAVASVAGRWP